MVRDSKSGYRKVVQVRFLFRAQLIGCQGVALIRSSLFFCSFSIVFKDVLHWILHYAVLKAATGVVLRVSYYK